MAAEYDLAVVGAGINGAGIARDAAMRGLSVVVLDKGDAAAGTTWASSRLIHGGLRYLEYGEIPLVFESLRERKTLVRIAPHLVRPLRMCIPLYASAKRGPILIRLGMIAYDLLSIGKSLPRHRMLDRDAILAEEPGLNAGGLEGAARYYDAQVSFAERLVLENLLAARDAGAEVRLHSEVTGIGIEAGAVRSIRVADRIEGGETELGVRAVVNAAGPWVDKVLGRADGSRERLIGGTKGSHIVLRRFEGGPRDAFYVEAESDGRPVFVLPWNGAYLVGTTDIRYDGDLDDLRASRAEVDYLLAETNRVFPGAGLAADDICYAYAGVRPLPYSGDKPVSAITRRHVICTNTGIADGLLSIVGGKLTTYRELSEQAVDRVGRLLARSLPRCRTASIPLPGAPGAEAAAAALQSLGALSGEGVRRLVDVYGGRASGIAQLARERPALAEPIDGRRMLLAAEIAFVAREEMPRTLTDIVYRRSMLGLDPDQGRAHYDAIADVASAELGWDGERRRRERESLGAYADSLREFG